MGLLRRWWIVLVCAAALAVAFTGYRLQWGFSEVPDPATLHDLVYPVSVQEFDAGSPGSLAFLLESWAPGRTLTVVDARGVPLTITLVLRQGTVPLILTGLGGLVFLAVAIGFFAPRFDQPGIGEFFWISLLYGISICLGGVFFPRAGSLTLNLFGVLQFACLAFLPVIFLRLALSFPLRSDFLDRRRWLLPACFLAAVGIVAWQAVVHHRYFADPEIDPVDQTLFCFAAYNAGPHRVTRWLPDRTLPADIWIELVPFAETRGYLRRVLAYMVIYEKRMGKDPTRLAERLHPVPPDVEQIRSAQAGKPVASAS